MLTPLDNGQLLLANMTLYAPNGLQMIMMERFEGLTAAVDCKGDDGTMSLTFNSQQASDYAMKSWSHINEKDEDRFLLIANHAGCGPDDERQPYLISKVTRGVSKGTDGKKKWEIFFAATPAPWSDVAGTYELDFGKVTPFQNAHRLKARGFIDGLFGDFDKSKSVSVPLNVGKQGERRSIYKDGKGRLNLDCTNCFVTGSLKLTGHLVVDDWHLKDLSLDASPAGLAAALELEAIITADSAPQKLQDSKELFSAPIPSAGFHIPGIFKMGATLSYEIGVGAAFQGSATIDFGLTSTVPDSAKAVLDLSSQGDSSATGFDGTVEPHFKVKKASASVTLSASSQLKLALGIEITKIGKADVALLLKLPEVSSTLSAEYDKAGLCSHDAGASTTGVILSNQVAVLLDAQADLDFGDDDAKPSWEKNLFTWKHPLGENECFAMPIPGLGGPAESTCKYIFEIRLPFVYHIFRSFRPHLKEIYLLFQTRSHHVSGRFGRTLHLPILQQTPSLPPNTLTLTFALASKATMSSSTSIANSASASTVPTTIRTSKVSVATSLGAAPTRGQYGNATVAVGTSGSSGTGVALATALY